MNKSKTDEECQLREPNFDPETFQKLEYFLQIYVRELKESKA